MDLPMVVQLVERKSVSYSQPVDCLEPVDWLPLAEQDLVSHPQLADYLELVGSAVTGLSWSVEPV